jgi:outer membrane protein TolC
MLFCPDNQPADHLDRSILVKGDFMNRYTAALLLQAFLVGIAGADNGALNLSLKESLRLAVEKNLDLKAEFYSPAQAESDVRINRAIYETHLTLNTSYQDSSAYSLALKHGIDQRTFTLSPGAYKLLPSGGTVELSFLNVFQDGSTVAPVGSYWNSSLGLTLTQPLLKNFGRETTELNIRVAETAKTGSLSHLKSRVMATVAQVASEYYRLGSLREDLESKKVSLQLAKTVLTDTEARVRAGVMPAMEILNAQFGVSSREKDLIDAEKAVSDQVDLLRLLLQLDGGTEIVPTDKPDRSVYELDEKDAISKALSSRPELDELLSQLKSFELQSNVAKSQTKPNLNLVTSAALTGADRKYGRDMERTGSMDYPVWSIGLQFDYPLGNQAAENDYIKSRLRTDQLKVQIDSLKSSITNEVKGAIRSVQVNYKQLDVVDRARAYADERLKAYLKKLEVGLATNKDLLDVENDLAAARTNQIKAQAAYAISLQQYWKATGELLDKEGIVIGADRSDSLYRGVQ